MPSFLPTTFVRSFFLVIFSNGLVRRYPIPHRVSGRHPPSQIVADRGDPTDVDREWLLEKCHESFLFSSTLPNHLRVNLTLISCRMCDDNEGCIPHRCTSGSSPKAVLTNAHEIFYSDISLRLVYDEKFKSPCAAQCCERLLIAPSSFILSFTIAIAIGDPAAGSPLHYFFLSGHLLTFSNHGLVRRYPIPHQHPQSRL
ncbi:hypothetical protein B0H34DRAFT_732195 [Crassisporium funariophilum]|nr:hypothetical protein B0H34DRAFT_732195 [Crassisporium funariophilum]